MIYITGDKHGHFDSIEAFCQEQHTTKDDVLIVLGDLGVNYYGGRRDRSRKKYLNDMPITIFAIRGNHERRPEKDWSIRTVATNDVIGTFVVEPGYESILYAQDGRSYGLHTSDGWKQSFVIGGAYSVDKYYRLGQYAAGNHNALWFEDEQLSEDEMNQVMESLVRNIDLQKSGDLVLPYFVLTHTCPFSQEPVDMFLPFIDQSTVETQTEEFLDRIKKVLVSKGIDYRWYCGHWHTDRVAPDNLRFVFNDFIAL